MNDEGWIECGEFFKVFSERPLYETENQTLIISVLSFALNLIQLSRILVCGTGESTSWICAGRIVVVRAWTHHISSQGEGTVDWATLGRRINIASQNSRVNSVLASAWIASCKRLWIWWRVTIGTRSCAHVVIARPSNGGVKNRVEHHEIGSGGVISSKELNLDF